MKWHWFLLPPIIALQVFLLCRSVKEYLNIRPEGRKYQGLSVSTAKSYNSDLINRIEVALIRSDIRPETIEAVVGTKAILNTIRKEDALRYSILPLRRHVTAEESRETYEAKIVVIWGLYDPLKNPRFQ